MPKIGTYTRESIVEAYTIGGLKPSEIASQMEVSLPSVYTILHAAGVMNSGTANEKRREETLDRDAKILDSLQSGMSAGEISRKYGIVLSTVYYVIRAAGFSARDAVEDAKTKTMRFDIAVEMYQKGYKLHAIKDETGISATQLYNELYKRGIPSNRNTNWNDVFRNRVEGSDVQASETEEEVEDESQTTNVK